MCLHIQHHAYTNVVASLVELYWWARGEISSKHLHEAQAQLVELTLPQ